MNNTILIAGSTGLIGSTFLDLIKEDQDYENIIALTRKTITGLESFKKVRQRIINFNDLEQFNDVIKVKALVCALGTTIKKAGSKENFRKVDFQYPAKIAKIALKNGAENIIIVSSIGADRNSSSFYLKTKGELEDAVSRCRPYTQAFSSSWKKERVQAHGRNRKNDCIAGTIPLSP